MSVIESLSGEATVKVNTADRRIEHSWVLGEVAEGKVVAKLSFAHWPSSKSLAAVFTVLVAKQDGAFSVEMWMPFQDSFTFVRESVGRFSAKALDAFAQKASAVFFAEHTEKASALIEAKIAEQGGLL